MACSCKNIVHHQSLDCPILQEKESFIFHKYHCYKFWSHLACNHQSNSFALVDEYVMEEPVPPQKSIKSSKDSRNYNSYSTIKVSKLCIYPFDPTVQSSRHYYVEG